MNHHDHDETAANTLVAVGAALIMAAALATDWRLAAAVLGVWFVFSGFRR
jgi:hypothetical protein